jgi:hypothetical protein
VLTASRIRAMRHNALIMEAISISETSANFYETTRYNVQNMVIFILAIVRT